MKPWLPAASPVLIIFGLLYPFSMLAQERDSTRSDSAPMAMRQQETSFSAHPCFGGQDHEEEDRRAKKAYANLPGPARFWLTEDAFYIISPQERCAFLLLSTDRERTQFIQQFWARRAPDPTSLDNSFELEHYKRIAFADEKYGERISGWKTDRGRIYILFGPPHSIESHRAGEKNDCPTEVGPQTFPYPAEVWHYHHLRGVDDDVELCFLDPDGSGNFRLSLSPEGKVEPIFIPSDVFGFGNGGIRTKSTRSIELYVGPMPTPQVKFKDLEAIVTARVIRDQVRFDHRIEYSKATDATTLARITVSIPAEQANSAGYSGGSPAEFEVFGRISEPSGWVARTLESKIPPDERRDAFHSRPGEQIIAALAPGTHRLAIVVKNVATGEVGVSDTSIEVPSYTELDAKK